MSIHIALGSSSSYLPQQQPLQPLCGHQHAPPLHHQRQVEHSGHLLYRNTACRQRCSVRGTFLAASEDVHPRAFGAQGEEVAGLGVLGMGGGGRGEMGRKEQV